MVFYNPLGNGQPNSRPTGRILEWMGFAPRHTLTWILRDINFSVAAGESVGLIGRNGAGKSTLLKLITGVSTPTEGFTHMAGRVAALLELGLGFHAEFTGRQNVCFNVLNVVIAVVSAKA